ncbi:MAG: TolC family protein [Paludibacteraceae bacterium]|nr:TolC family protein [Paludibacteraceae bacterium]
MKKFVLVMTLVVSVLVNAQDSTMIQLEQLLQPQYSSTLTLSLAEAQKFAIEQNRDLQNASLEVKKAHAKRWQTIAALLPQGDGTFGRNLMYDDDWNEKTIQLNPLQPPMSMSPWTLGLTVSEGVNAQAIVGAILNTLAIEMQDLSYQKTESQLRGNVLVNYTSVLVLADVATLLDSSLVNVSYLAEQTKQMVKVGAAEQTQYDQIYVKVNALRNSANAAKRNYRLALDALKVLLNVDASTDLQLTETTDQVLDVEHILGILFEDYDIQRNLDYQLLEKNVELAEKNVIMAGMAYLPTVAAFYKYTGQYGKDVFTMMSSPHTVGVSLSMPIWSSGKRASAITENKIALQEAENTFSQTKDNLDIQYQNLRYTLVNNYETYVNQKENNEVTMRVMKNISDKYKWGAASALDLTTASNDLITAQSSYVQAVMNLVQSAVDLEIFLNNK